MTANQTHLHTVAVSGYADVGLDDACEWFRSSLADEVLDRAMAAAVGADVSHLRVQVREPERLSKVAARVPVEWETTSQTGREHHGVANLLLLMVQSGIEPKTEVLATLQVEDEVARPAGAALHQMVDSVCGQIDLRT
jgi:hypothetical protein